MSAHWKLQGLCNQVGEPDDWYPRDGRVGSYREARRRERDAATVCGQCPVREICLQFAIDNREPWGVWGGKTPDQRRRIIEKKPSERTPAPIKHGTNAGYFLHYRRKETPCAGCREAHALNRTLNMQKKRARVVA